MSDGISTVVQHAVYICSLCKAIYQTLRLAATPIVSCTNNDMCHGNRHMHAAELPCPILHSMQGTAPACTMSCLIAGCVYQVRIRAQNSSGWGQYCLPSEVASAPGVPHAPGVPKGTSSSAVCVHLQWAVPKHDGGSNIASYRLEMSSGKPTERFASRAFCLSTVSCIDYVCAEGKGKEEVPVLHIPCSHVLSSCYLCSKRRVSNMCATC